MFRTEYAMGWGEINPWRRQGAEILATALIMLIVLFSVSHMKAAAFKDATHLGQVVGTDGPSPSIPPQCLSPWPLWLVLWSHGSA